ncbi:haloacid dehalogenase-like hydrolase family protein [Tritrichomonas foetus]|uniref:Haloacid dehalogenase-like hydrolase family protein n=1 Tax=Tritrichomonas foetus TaxID=1144522 RepID=A0A1J4KC67_9EUKA|nr:haloacid dehalogenase-like hydrolase family protein [Tritrichomonas foetus]|eukprot:OHT07254.1 haloacid dehalogenase-like hydrolase family protein [Tritrichomonas foetus]
MTAKQIFISWDIDGTLILGKDATKFHLEAFHLACEELFGKCDTPEVFLGHSIDGMMDSSILSEMITKLGHQPTEETLKKTQEKMEDIFIQNCTAIPEVPNGVVETLEQLVKYPNITMAIASGNYPRIAWRKLELCGIAKYFPDRLGGLGVIRERKDAVSLARKLAEEKKGHKFDIYMHIGDTPSDILAAQAAGSIPFGVRTGRVNYPEYPTPSYIHNNLIEGHDELFRLLGLE